MTLAITDISFVLGTPADQRTGLVAYLSMTLDGALRVDGVTVRRTAAGRLALAFPMRVDRGGRAHPYIRPLDQTAREAIERLVLAALEAEGLLP